MVTVRRGADIEEREIERKKKEEAIFSLLIESGFSSFLLPVTMVLRKVACLHRYRRVGAIKWFLIFVNLSLSRSSRICEPKIPISNVV